MPEITLADQFGREIRRTLLEFRLSRVLEIGSWDGTGSTAVIVGALSELHGPELTCLEIDAARCDVLRRNLLPYEWANPHCRSSISFASFTPKDFDRDVWQSPHNYLGYPRELVEQWWHGTLEQLNTVDIGYLEEFPDAEYDAVLIDGCEFTGWDEFRLVRERTRCVMLDDAFSAYKTARVHATLLDAPEWRLVWANRHVRNGAAIWMRV